MNQRIFFIGISIFLFFLCSCSAPEIKKDFHQNAIPKRPVNYNCKHHQNKQFIYDDHGRIVKVLGPENRIKEFRYNKRGYIQTIITNDEKQEFEYNINGKIIRCKDSTGTTKIDRYPDGNIHRMIYPSGYAITYSYYDDGKLFEIIWKNNHYLSIYRNVLGDAVKIDTPVGTFKIQYDYNKRFVQRIYPNGAFSQFTYNEEGFPVHIQHAAPSSRLILDLTYHYMGSGRLESVTEKNIYTDITIQYKYDSNGQLLSASYSDGRQYHYQYDMFGNRTQVSYPDKTPVKSVYSCGLITKFNQDSVKNDALGNIAAIGSEHFKFNHHNFLKEDNLFHYDYNALGLRTRVKNNKNEQTQLFHMIDDLPYIFATQGKERVYYFWADGQCLGQSSNKTGVQYFFEDHLGSIRCVINQNGDIVGYAEYTPFGIPVQRIYNIRFGYAGEEQDVSGKLYLRSRYYMPSIGRFISRDPQPYNFTSSLKWNWYTYVGNSPVNFKDPDGCYAKDNRKSSMEEAEYKTYRFFRYAASSIGNVSDNKNQNAIYNMSRFTPITGAGTVAIMPSMTPIASKLVNQLNEPVYRKSIYGAALATELIGKIPMPYNYIPDIASQVLYTYHDTYRVQHHQISKEEYVHNIVERVLGNLAPDLPSSSKNSSFMNRVTDDIPKTMLHYLNSPHMNKINNIINMAPVDNKYTSSLVIHPELIERIAVNAFRSFQTPNVGGVYLDKATKFIGKLSDIQGVVYDPSSNRIILVGEDGSNLSLPEFRMDHLAAAFRTVYGDYTLEPGVTIDPNPENPKSEKMIVRFFGGMENTHFGHILFEADRQMKGLSLGIDNISKEKQGVSVNGYYNLLTLSLSKNKNHYSKELWSRFWLVPEKIVARKSDDGKSILFSDVKIRIKTETMRWENGKLVSAGDLKDDHAEYFAQHFSKYYDEYAKEYPIYNDLKQLAKIVAIVKWIKEEGFPIDMNWLEQYDLFYKTPETTPALTVSDKKETQNSNMINIQNVSIFGGTDLTVFPEYLKTHNLSDSFSKKIIHSIHNKPDISDLLVSYNHKNKRAIVLPTSETRSGGALLIAEKELEILDRVYCSFHNHQKEFGHSWMFNLPVLRFTNPYRGKQKTVEVNGQKATVRYFQMSKPFGFENINFKKHVVDQQFGTIAFLPDKNIGIRALYPDESKGEYRVQYKDGSIDIFNHNGKLICHRESWGAQIKYEYDRLEKLVRVTRSNQDIIDTDLQLKYDPEGRIETANVHGKQIKYIYNADGDIIQMISDKQTIHYQYDDSHLLIQKQSDKNEISYAYDEWGRLISQKDNQGNVLSRRITHQDNQIKIIESDAKNTFTYVYDQGGRLLKAFDKNNQQIAAKYNETGEISSIALKNRLGDEVKFEYFNNNRTIKYTNAEGVQRTYVFDEFNRLLQIQNDKTVLVSNQHMNTTKGWLKQSETMDMKREYLYNKDMNPTKIYITGKSPKQGQVVIQTKYDHDKIIQHSFQGLINEKWTVEGLSLKIKSDNHFAEINHDKLGKPIEIKSKSSKTSIDYDDKGFVKTIHYQKGKYGRDDIYHNGNIMEISDSNGLKIEYDYDKQNQLVGVKRSDGEYFEIYRTDNTVEYIRNNQYDTGYKTDSKNRLDEIKWAYLGDESIPNKKLSHPMIHDEIKSHLTDQQQLLTFQQYNDKLFALTKNKDIIELLTIQSGRIIDKHMNEQAIDEIYHMTREMIKEKSTDDVTFLHAGPENAKNNHVTMQLGGVKAEIPISEMDRLMKGEKGNFPKLDQLFDSLQKQKKSDVVVFRDAFARFNLDTQQLDPQKKQSIDPLSLLLELRKKYKNKVKFYLDDELDLSISNLGNIPKMSTGKDVAVYIPDIKNYNITDFGVFKSIQNLMKKADIHIAHSTAPVAQPNILVLSAHKDENFRSYIEELKNNGSLQDKYVALFSCYLAGDESFNSRMIQEGGARAMLFFSEQINPSAVQHVMNEFIKIVKQMNMKSKKVDLYDILNQSVDNALDANKNNKNFKKEIKKIHRGVIQISFYNHLLLMDDTDKLI